MSDIAIPVVRADWAWLRSPSFDVSFLFGILGLALATGAVVQSRPDLFPLILLFDLWFLGYHHVIATYTRLCFDRKSMAEHRSLVVTLPLAVALVTLAVAYTFGLWTVVSVYFYWQWFHYTRQSWGISRAYRGKDRDKLYEDGWLDQAIFYALPVLGILNRSEQDPGWFIGIELKAIPVPGAAVDLASVVALGLLLVWACRRLQAWRQGRLAVVHTLYMLTHFTIFTVGYLAISDISHGWLVINIWHNAQYILFVWMFNTRRFKDGVDPQARLLSYLSQPKRLWLYLATCLAITGALYWGVLRTIDWLFFAGLSATIVMYQILNFHHYIVDSRIWKVRAAPIRKTLELQD
jgi:hypothetical protein